MQIINIVKSRLVTALVVVRDAVLFGTVCILLIAFMCGFISGYFGA